jgi:hypothetical protein
VPEHSAFAGLALSLAAGANARRVQEAQANRPKFRESSKWQRTCFVRYKHRRRMR